MQDQSGVGAGDSAILPPESRTSVHTAHQVRERDLHASSDRQDPGFAAQWRRSYGALWWVDITCFGAIVLLLGAMLPLVDADLPMHLATGEWIVRHRTVPFIEPFAWTRQGAPYYAYSWALELLCYGVMRFAGPVGLHLLQGVILLAAAGAVLFLARSAGWRPWVALTMAVLNVAAAMLVVPALRPQLALFVLVPLAWAWAYRIVMAPRIRWAVVAMLLTSAAAANSHLFFVLTAAPISLVVARPSVGRRRALALCGAIVAGWLLSPYGLSWLEVFRLNFGYNALLVQPSPILEFRPGFRASTALLLALPLATLPWVIPRDSLARREKVIDAALWLAGLVAFAYAGRLLLCWWLITLPQSASALETASRHETGSPPRRVVRVATYALILLLSVTLVATMPAQWRNEGNAISRRLPVSAGSAIEPLVVWLECSTEPGTRGRIFTWFNYGSYLTWRLPGYSASIDGRTIFPDSVAKAGTLVSGLLPRREQHVWSSADLAIVPLYFGVATTLDSASSWQRAVSFYPSGEVADSVALWVKRAWWSSVSGRNDTLPPGGVVLRGIVPERGDRLCDSQVASQANQ